MKPNDPSTLSITYRAPGPHQLTPSPSLCKYGRNTGCSHEYISRNISNFRFSGSTHSEWESSAGFSSDESHLARLWTHVWWVRQQSEEVPAMDLRPRLDGVILALAFLKSQLHVYIWKEKKRKIVLILSTYPYSYSWDISSVHQLCLVVKVSFFLWFEIII